MSVWCLNIEFRGHSHPPVPMAETVMSMVMTMMYYKVAKMNKYKLGTASTIFTGLFGTVFPKGGPPPFWDPGNLVKKITIIVYFAF